MRRLPLFVLPTVLFPRTRIPLHVFEPRYRQMVARCLEYDKRFELLFHRNDLYGPFHLAPGRVGCVAQINAFQPLPDGRSLMVSEGVERFRVADGVDLDALYYEALVEEYGDDPEDENELLVRRRQSIHLFEEMLRSLPEPPENRPQFDPRRETSFELASTIEIDPIWHQGLLESRRESERLDQIDDILRTARDSLLERGE